MVALGETAELISELGVLLVHSVLLLLDGFNDFLLGCLIEPVAFVVAGELSGLVLPAPLGLGEVNPRLRCRFDFGVVCLFFDEGDTALTVLVLLLEEH